MSRSEGKGEGGIRNELQLLPSVIPNLEGRTGWGLGIIMKLFTADTN